jgi:hypothetical protein
MADFNWICPYCAYAQVVGSAKSDTDQRHICIGNLAEGSLSYRVFSIGCANIECRRLTFDLSVFPDVSRPDGFYQQDGKLPIFAQRLLPRSASKPQPDFIPFALREDYVEACEIKMLSPKASATLARRCLQGMVRDFCGIARSTLDQEIKELDRMVSAETAPQGVSSESVQAIDQVRSIGNIGAHMERDINTIINVDSEEAQSLIDLIELLFDEWYSARNSRQMRLLRIADIAEQKRQAIADAREKQIALPAPATK